MVLPRIRVEGEADVEEAVDGLERVRRGFDNVDGAADRAASAQDRYRRSTRGTLRDSRVLGRGIQNAAFQFGDFATQVGSGTSASIALGQQLPQLFIGFGALGAVVGAVAATIIPLSRVVRGNAEAMDALGQSLGTTAPMFRAIAQAMSSVKDVAIDFANLIVNNLDRIIVVAGVAAVAFGTTLAANFIIARVAAFSLVGALTAIRAALIRTGIGALIIGAGELVYQFTRLVQAMGSFSDAFALVGQAVIEIVTKRIMPTLQRIGLEGGAVFMDIRATALNAMANIVDFLGPFANDFLNVYRGLFNSVKAIFDQLPAVLGGAMISAANSILGTVTRMINGILGAVNGLTENLPDWMRPEGGKIVGTVEFDGIDNPFEGAGARAMADASAAFRRTMAEDFLSVGDMSGGLRGSASAAGRLAELLRSQSSAITGGALSEDLESVQAIRDILASIQENNIDLPSLLGASTDENGRSAAGRAADEAVAQIDRIRMAQEMLREAGRDTWSALGGFIQQFAGKSKAAAIAAIAIQKGLSIAQIMSNTAAAQMRALAELGPFAGPPVAAKIGAYGKLQAALVAATGLAQASQAGGGSAPSLGGGSGGGGGGGGGGFVQPDQGGSMGGQRIMNVALYGDLFTRGQFESFIERQNEFLDNGGVVRVTGGGRRR